MVRYAKYTITQGDTLQGIAQHMMGDASQWGSIARYNKLKHPYITDNPSDKLDNDHVACYGDVIIVPINVSLTAMAEKPMNMDTKKTIEELYYGRDISMTATYPNDPAYEATDGILAMGTDAQGVPMIVGGIDNLVQASITRLMTVRGSLHLHPEYGSDLRSYLGTKITSELLTIIELEVQSSLIRDWRIKRASCSATHTKHNQVELYIEVVTANFEEIVPFVLSLDNTSDGEFSIIN